MIPLLGSKHPVEEMKEEQREQIFEDWQESVRDKFPSFSGEKNPVLIQNQDPLFLSTLEEPTPDEAPRAWSHLRRNFMASPVGYDNGEFHTERPPVNWLYPFHSEQTWEELKEGVLEPHPEADRMVVNMSYVARDNMLTAFKKHLKDDEETALVNPIPIMDMFHDKQETFNFLDRNNYPAIPSVEASRLFYDGEEELENEIGHSDNGYVIKPKNGFGGDGVIKVDGFDEIRHLLNSESGIRETMSEIDFADDSAYEDSVDEILKDPEKLWEGYMIQSVIPHNSDLRVIQTGDMIANAERRNAADGNFCTNLDTVSSRYDGKDFGIYTKTLNALEQGRIEPLYLNLLNKPGKSSDLGSGAEALVNDIVHSITEESEYKVDSSLPQPPIKTGADLIEAEIEDVQHLPDEWIERAVEYSDNDTVYFIPELNGNPGSGADIAAMYAEAPEQVSGIHTYNLMRDLAGLEPYELDETVENLGDSDEGSLYKRILGFYPHSVLTEDEYMRLAKTNDK